MRVIDLSQCIEGGMDVYPGDPEVVVKEVCSIERDGWRLKELSLGSHTGTHVDAFSHMSVDGLSLDEIPIERFFGDAVLVSVDDDWPSGVGLMFRDGLLDEGLLDRFLSVKAPFVAVGDDAEISVELERLLLQEGVVTHTDLVNLSELPVGVVFRFFGVPLKIKDGDGSPTRAFAILED